MKLIPALICNHITLTIKDARQKKAALTAKKSSALGSTLQKYAKMLDELQEDANRLEQEMKALGKLFIKAAKVSVKKQLEDSIATFKESREKLAKASALVIQIKEDFGDNPASKKLLDHADKLVKDFQALNKEQEEALSALTKTHVPVQLTTHDNDFFRPLIAYIVGDLKKTTNKSGENPDLLIKKSKYIPGIVPGNAGQIRWARYIPLINIPTIFGEIKNTHLVVCITFMAYSEAKGKIVPMMLTDKRGVEKPAISQISLGILNKFNDPIALSSVLYKVASLNEAKDVLAYLAQKNNLAVFGQELEGSTEERMEKVKEKLQILTLPDVKIIKDKNKRNFITVKVPMNKVDTNISAKGSFLNTSNPTEWDKNLYMEVQSYAGLPKNSKYNYGRLAIEKVYSDKDKEHMYFLFRVLSITKDKLNTDTITNKKLDSMGVEPEFDMDIGGRGGLTDAGLQNYVNSWLNMK